MHALSIHALLIPLSLLISSPILSPPILPPTPLYPPAPLIPSFSPLLLLTFPFLSSLLLLTSEERQLDTVHAIASNYTTLPC